MRVVTVDGNGRELGDPKWFDIPEPDSFAADGFAHIESYVARLLQSSASFTSLLLATPDGQIAVSLWQRGGVTHLNLSVAWREQGEQEYAIRQFIAERKLTLFRDYLAGNGDVPDATRRLSYSLPADASFITTLTKDLLWQIYGLKEQEALDFSYEEH